MIWPLKSAVVLPLAITTLVALTLTQFSAAVEPRSDGAQSDQLPTIVVQGLPLGLLKLERVKKELDLTREQCKSIETVEQQVRDECKELPTTPDIRGLSDEERAVKLAEIRSKFEDLIAKGNKIVNDARPQLSAILSPRQRTRLRELQVQLYDGPVIATPEPLILGTNELGVTAEQRRQLNELISRSFVGPTRLLEMSAEERKQLATKISERSREAVEQILTNYQRANLLKMRGEPFNFTNEERRLATRIKSKRPADSSPQTRANGEDSPAKTDVRPDEKRERK